MATHPDAEFDHAVLDLIEHSPTGAVPHTPAYQDALNRLCASQQVYPDADHRDGFVTARSLAARSCYVASNLEALAAGSIASAELESNASIFERYLKGLNPALTAKAADLRPKLAGRLTHHRMHAGTVAAAAVHSLFLVPGTGPNRGIAGNYLYGWLVQLDPDAPTGRWAVQLHDGDDGAATCEADTLAEAVAKLQEVIASAPFHLSELEALGFRSN